MKLIPAALAFLCASATMTAGAGETPRHIMKEPTSPARLALPFSDAVSVGDTVYVSGHLGADPKTGQAPQDLDAEIKIAMDGVQSTLKAAGLTMDDLVSVTVYSTDLGLYDRFNTVYRTYFHGKFPARAFVGVATLLRGAHVEVQGVAVRPGAPQSAK